MKLKHTITQKDLSGNSQHFCIEVDYDPSEKTVDRILEVYAWDERSTIDLSYIMTEMFEDQLDEMVDKINWAEEYANSVEEPSDLFKALSYAAYAPYVPKEELDKVIYNKNNPAA